MKSWLVLISLVVLVHGSPFKPTPASAGDSDKLEAFPWIKASKAKARFGTTTSPPCTTAPPSLSADSVPVAEVPVSSQKQQQPLQQLALQPALTPEMLQSYIAALAAQLQPFVVDNSAPSSTPPPSKKASKGKPGKLKVRDTTSDSTTEAYWMAEKKMYPDSLYDEFYLDWLRKRQIEEIPVATPTSVVEDVAPTSVTSTTAQQQPAPPQPYPAAPMTMNPYLMNPYLYSLAGFKVSKAMANAQVSAALAALNITTTAKPVKIKLKIPIPAGSDVAQVVASGIAGFPAGTTYELSKKK